MLLFADEEMDKFSKKVIQLVKGHPEGIPVLKLAVFYNQKYHHNLVVSDAGFSNIADFIASLSEHLVVKNRTIFHRKRIPQTQDTGEDEQEAHSCPEGIFLPL